MQLKQLQIINKTIFKLSAKYTKSTVKEKHFMKIPKRYFFRKNLINSLIRKSTSSTVLKTKKRKRAVRSLVTRKYGDLLSSVDGKIHSVLVAYPESSEDFKKGDCDTFFKKIFQPLVCSLEESKRVYILVEKDFLKTLEGVYSQEPTNQDIREILDFFTRRVDNLIEIEYDNFNIWIQDHFIVANCSRHKTTLLLKSIVVDGEQLNDKIGTNNVPVQIAKYGVKDLLVEVKTIPLQLQGGNMLVGEDFILIGESHRNLNEKLREHSDLLEEHFDCAEIFRGEKSDIIEAVLETRKQRIYVGSANADAKINPNSIGKWLREDNYIDTNLFDSFQPIYHIDLMMALAGKNSEDKQRLVVSYPVNPFRRNHDETILDVALIHPLRAKIAQAIEELEKQRLFEIIPMPLPFIYTAKAPSYNKEWFPLSYCNCLVEKNNSYSGNVWMPWYSELDEPRFFIDWEASENRNDKVFKNWKNKYSQFKSWNELARKIWDDLDFNVLTPIRDSSRLAEKGGGIHCIVKTLKREKSILT